MFGLDPSTTILVLLLVLLVLVFIIIWLTEALRVAGDQLRTIAQSDERIGEHLDSLDASLADMRRTIDPTGKWL